PNVCSANAQPAYRIAPLALVVALCFGRIGWCLHHAWAVALTRVDRDSTTRDDTDEALDEGTVACAHVILLGRWRIAPRRRDGAWNQSRDWASGLRKSTSFGIT